MPDKTQQQQPTRALTQADLILLLFDSLADKEFSFTTHTHHSVNLAAVQ
jgi:hypothetical protein